MTIKDVKEITYMPCDTFFSVLERPGGKRKGVASTPLVRRGLMLNFHIQVPDTNICGRICKTSPLSALNISFKERNNNLKALLEPSKKKLKENWYTMQIRACTVCCSKGNQVIYYSDPIS